MVTTFVTPVLYLAAMGVGLGSFINKGGHAAALGDLSYLQFVAPALAATTAATIGGERGAVPGHGVPSSGSAPISGCWPPRCASVTCWPAT